MDFFRVGCISVLEFWFIVIKLMAGAHLTPHTPLMDQIPVEKLRPRNQHVRLNEIQTNLAS